MQKFKYNLVIITINNTIKDISISKEAFLLKINSEMTKISNIASLLISNFLY